MSRVGKKDIIMPDEVDVEYIKNIVTVRGKKGTLILILNSGVKLLISKKIINVIVQKNNKNKGALQGLTRSLIANMITGVTKGFEKFLEINGIGYRVELKDKSLIFNIGYSHPVNFKIPEDIDVSIEKNIIKLFGIDKNKIGQIASSIRQLRPPEPYKGKGIRYVNEYVRRKTGKTGSK